MRLKKLIIVRHGEYSHLNYRLDAWGKSNVSKLAVAIKEELTQEGLIDPSVFIMSSTAARAVETAEIIAGHLDVNSFDQYPTLVSEGGLYEYQVQDVCRHINEHGKDHDVIILSTHMEFIDQFPRRWSGLHDWEKKVPNYHGSSKATARMIDVVNQTVTYIVPKDLLR